MSESQQIYALQKLCNRLADRSTFESSDDMSKLLSALGTVIGNQQGQIRNLRERVAKLDAQVQELAHPVYVL